MIPNSGAWLLALGGYAIGTAQVLALDWVRNRLAHARHLRFLRAELRRLSGFTQRFEWTEEGPTSDAVPRPPIPTSKFLDTIAATDFYLTDEHSDDNSQQALLDVVDGCSVLERYSQDIHAFITQLADTPAGPKKQDIKERLRDTTREYDNQHKILATMLKSSVQDLERRVTLSSLWMQASRRPLGSLPRGSNPPPLKPGDPRIG